MCFCLLPANLAFVYVIQGYNVSETSTTYTYWYIKPCPHIKSLNFFESDMLEVICTCMLKFLLMSGYLH